MGAPPRREPLPVAVVMPVYNGAHLIRAALASLVAQTRPPTEVVVVDDLSTDGSAEVAATFEDLLPLRIVRQDVNAGPGVARRRALELTEQPWIAPLDADDLVLPNHLDVLWTLAGGDEHVIAAPARIEWDEADGTIRPVAHTAFPADSVEQLRAIAKLNSVPIASMFSRRRALAAGSYPTRRKSEDFELWLRLLVDGARVEVAQTPTFVYRRLPVSNSSRRRRSDQGLAGGRSERDRSCAAPSRSGRVRTAIRGRHSTTACNRGPGCPAGRGALPGSRAVLSRMPVRRPKADAGWDAVGGSQGSRLVLTSVGRPLAVLDLTGPSGRPHGITEIAVRPRSNGPP